MFKVGDKCIIHDRDDEWTVRYILDDGDLLCSSNSRVTSAVYWAQFNANGTGRAYPFAVLHKKKTTYYGAVVQDAGQTYSPYIRTLDTNGCRCSTRGEVISACELDGQSIIITFEYQL